MPDPSITIIRKGQLAKADYLAHLDESDCVATLSPAKRKFLLSNPLSLSDDDPVQLLGLSNGKVIGRLDVICGEIQIAVEKHRTLWGSNLYVPVQHRSTLMGMLLLLELQNITPLVSVCGVSQQALPLYQQLGWTEIAMPRYILFRRCNCIVRRYLGTNAALRAISEIANGVIRVGLWGLHLVPRLRAGAYTVEQIEEPASVIDDLFAHCSRGVSAHRSSRWLQWILSNRLDSDEGGKAAAYVVRNRRGQVVAYFGLRAKRYPVVTHRQFPDVFLGSLKDWCIADQSGITYLDLIMLACRVFAEWNVDAVEVCATPDSPVSLRTLGFIPAGALRFFAISDSKHPITDQFALTQILCGIRPAESDNFYG